MADLRFYWRQQHMLALYLENEDRALLPESTLRRQLAERLAVRDWKAQPFPIACDPITGEAWPVTARRPFGYREWKLLELSIERLDADLELAVLRDAA
jgi:hypothetical protein